MSIFPQSAKLRGPLASLTRRQSFSLLPFAAAVLAQKSNFGKSGVKESLTLLGQKVSPRKFELGQVVCCSWEENISEGFKAAVDVGVVVGYWWAVADSSVNFINWHQNEWVYIVAYFDCQSSDSQHCPFLEIGGESELEPFED